MGFKWIKRQIMYLFYPIMLQQLLYSFEQKFEQIFLEMLHSKRIGHLEPTLRNYFPALFVVSVLLRLRFNYFIIAVIREPHYLYNNWVEIS